MIATGRHQAFVLGDGAVTLVRLTTEQADGRNVVLLFKTPSPSCWVRVDNKELEALCWFLRGEAP